MADIISLQELADAKLDAQSLEQFINGDVDEEVLTRLSQQYPTIKKLLLEFQKYNGRAYKTYAEMDADKANLSSKTKVTVTNDATASNNGDWQWDGVAFTKSAYDPLTQAKNYADANPLFNPVVLTTVNNADELVSNGLYTAPTTNIAQAVGFPFGTSGQLLVTTQPNYTLQTFFLDNGDILQRRKTVSGWTTPRGQVHLTLSASDNLNNLKKQGSYQCVNSNHATTANNYPFASRGLVLIQEGNSTVTQHFLALSGYAARSCRVDLVGEPWEEWRGISYPSGVKSLSNVVDVGQNPAKRVSTMDAMGASNLDNLTAQGVYHTTVRSIATTANGFPITDVIGILEISASSNEAVTQHWRTYKGYAVRWGSYNAQDVLTWQPWRGYLLSESGITQIGESATTTTQTQLITFGSSTLEYLEDELKTLATRKNLRLRPNAKSGYTLGAAGLNQGTNKMTVQFESGVITTGTNTVIIESSFNDDIRAAMTVELSNGVKGSLNYRDKTFTPSNLTASLTVSSTEKYKVTVPLWNDINHVGGIFVFNIGKNSVSSSTDNSDYIVEKTVEMIEAIPQGSKFIVGGHFSNWVGTTPETHHNVVHSVNQKLRLKYGLKYFDISELFAMDSTWTTLGLTKTADDIAAIAANRMPPSLSRDAAHMSAGMDLIVAQLIENKLIELGYIQ